MMGSHHNTHVLQNLRIGILDVSSAVLKISRYFTCTFQSTELEGRFPVFIKSYFYRFLGIVGATLCTTNTVLNDYAERRHMDVVYQCIIYVFKIDIWISRERRAGERDTTVSAENLSKIDLRTLRYNGYRY